MSSVSEKKPTLQEINSCANGLKNTKKSFVATKSSCEDSGPIKDVFSPAQTDSILGDLRTFAKPDGLKITNCIFRTDHVEICYVFHGSSDHDKDELRQKLAGHLKIDSQLMKMTKLRAKPTYKETTIRPGETAPIQGSCKIGAFVEVEGKGNHALVSGHGKREGDMLLYPNGHRLGVVNVSLQPELQPTASDNWCCYYKDVALVRLENQVNYIAQVLDDILGPLGLMEHPIYATNNMTVRRFARDGRRGRIDSAAYNIWDDTYNVMFRLISVVSEDGGPMHAEGDSGILIVTDTPVNGRVNAVGILVRLEEMDEDNDAQTDGVLAHRARDTVPFLERKVPDFVSPTRWSPNSPDLNSYDYGIWSVGLMQEKVYRSRIANVNELEMRLIDEWGRFDQSIVDAAIAASGAVVSTLVAVERGTL